MRLAGLFVSFLFLLAQPAFAQVAPLRVRPEAFDAPLPSQGLRTLEQRLTASLREQPGDFGVAAMDLETGQIVGVNANTPYPMASTMKVAVAAVYLIQVDQGRRSLEDTIGATTARALMERMLIRSDNGATDQLIAALGGPQVVHQWIRAQGLTGIRVDRNIADLLAARRDLWDVRDSSTPAAMLRLLRLIDRGNVLSTPSRFTLLDMMARCATGSNRIRGLLPAGTRVEHKTGTLNNYTGDIAYVTLPGGRRIAVVAFARGGANRPAVIATASRVIYDAFVEDATNPRAIYTSSRPSLPPGGPTSVRPGASVPEMFREQNNTARPRIMMPHPGQPLTISRDRPDRQQAD